MTLFKKKAKKQIEDYEDIFQSEELWDNPRDRGLSGFFRTLTSEGASVLVFAASFLVLLVGVIISAAAGGNAGSFVGFLGLLSFAGTVSGVAISLYGHLVIKIKSRISWLWGLIMNSVLAFVLLILFIAGAVSA